MKLSNINLPAAVAVGGAVLGAALAVAGVYLLAGLGWALLASALPCGGLSAVMCRGLMRGE